MNNLHCFVGVDFVDDANVSGYKFWYICPFENVDEGDEVIAPLGRHNNLQAGIVKQVLFAADSEAPYPVQFIKTIKRLIKKEDKSNE